MANRPQGFGLTAELARQQNQKYDYDDEQDALCWMEAVIDEGEIFLGIEGKTQTIEALKDGVYLCKLKAALQPGLVKKINASTSPFKNMENICIFLEACKAYGLRTIDMFQTSDLYDGCNLTAVINCIHSVGRQAQSKKFDGPILGPKESTKAPREFTEEQIVNGAQFIGLQMGTNKCANQSGLNFGKTRSILD